MRILVIGANGQVGTELIQAGAEIGHDMVASQRGDLDLSAGAEVLVGLTGFDGVINAAAYTAVDTAESDQDLARAVNTDAPGAIARACAAASLPFVHYSTDYVFDGSASAPLTESDPVSPLGAYGQSKRDGELAVLESGAVSAVLRLSWVFSAHGKNFVKTMLRVGPASGSVRVVSDQIGKPTPAGAAARAGIVALEALANDSDKAGIYHFAGDAETSWAGFAEAIFEIAGLHVPVTPIPTSDYPTPAARPAYSVLDTTKITCDLGIAAPDWRVDLAEVIKQLNTD